MTTKQEKVDEYFRLQPTKYSYVEKLELLQNGVGETTVVLLLGVTDAPLAGKLSLTFSKARNFSLDATDTALQFSLLNIVAVDDQWEDVNFRVFEDDQGLDCSFICADFTAQLIDE